MLVFVAERFGRVEELEVLLEEGCCGGDLGVLRLCSCGCEMRRVGTVADEGTGEEGFFVRFCIGRGGSFGSGSSGAVYLDWSCC
jgi:hypothetical protein